jgi:hypothetical protein
VGYGDGRELFVLNFDLTITTYLDDWCIGPEHNKLESGTPLWKGYCLGADVK